MIAIFLTPPAWHARTARAVVLAVSTLLATSISAAPAKLLEPASAGFFSLPATGAAPTMRDAARGWTYFREANRSSVEGVRITSWLFRLNDSGELDRLWRSPALQQPTDQYIAADGTIVVRAYVRNSPTFEQRWYRLSAIPGGDIVPVEVSDLASLPRHDHSGPLQYYQAVPDVISLGDGTLLTLSAATSTPASAGAAVLLRLLNRQNQTIWTRTLAGEAYAIALDSQNNVYLLGDQLSTGTKTGDLIRIRADGSVDSDWTASAGIATGSSARTYSRIRVVADKVIVTGLAGAASANSRITTFDRLTGRKASERDVAKYLSGIADDGLVLATGAEGHWTLLDPGRSDAANDSVSKGRVGTANQAKTAVRWGQRYVLGGNFRYWFDGKEYRNLMALDSASLRPDPAFAPFVADSVGAATVDPAGGLLIATNSASGTEAAVFRFNADGSPDSRWSPRFAGDVYSLVATADGQLYVGGAYAAANGVARRSLARFGADGALDLAWGSEPTWPVMTAARAQQWGRDGIYRLVDAGADGLFAQWEDGDMNGAYSEVMRLSRSGTGSQLSLDPIVATAPTFTTTSGHLLRDSLTGAVYTFVSAARLVAGAGSRTALVRILPPAMQIDRSWRPYSGEIAGQQYTGFAGQSNDYLYVCQNSLTPRVLRINKLTGLEDPNWSSDEAFLCNASLLERKEDGVAVVLSPIDGGLVQYSSTTKDAPLTVTEYYAREARRFFMTGRADEIRLLDALPQRFVRTGMTFSATSALVMTADTLTTPVCRFYAPPSEGGSNSHVYVHGDDCVAIKKYPWLRYEGFDFRAGLPNASGGCGAAFPRAVYRLFNQSPGGNDGNHRYVTTEARRTEMIAAGWVDEGVAFCAGSATDSAALGQLTR